MWPMQLFACTRNFVGAKRLAMRLRRAGTCRRTEADGRARRDEHGLVARLRRGKRLRHSVGIVAVAGEGVPAHRLEALARIRRFGERGGPVDRDVIVVEEHNEAVEFQMAREARRFLRYAFHQIAVARDYVSAVVDERVAEARIEDSLAERHADGGGDALTERACRRLHAWKMAVFGMAGAWTAQLAEPADVVERGLGVAGQI